jgi:prefoldin subunit 5
VPWCWPKAETSNGEKAMPNDNAAERIEELEKLYYKLRETHNKAVDEIERRFEKIKQRLERIEAATKRTD